MERSIETIIWRGMVLNTALGLMMVVVGCDCDWSRTGCATSDANVCDGSASPIDGGTRDVGDGEDASDRDSMEGHDATDNSDGSAFVDDEEELDVVPPDALHVAPWGDDHNPGTSDAPFRTINHGISVLDAGSVLVIREGEYDEVNYYLENVHGREGAWITIRGYPGERPLLRGSDYWKNIYIYQSSYIRIQGLELVGLAPETTDTAGNGIYIHESDHVVVIDCLVHDNGGCGVCAGQSDHVEISGNRIWGNALYNPYNTSAISLFEMIDDGSGDDADGYSNRIVGNVLWRNECVVPFILAPEWGVTDGNCVIIDCTDDTGYGGRTLVANNLCSDNGGRGLHVMRSSRVDVVNNTVFQNVRSTFYSVTEGHELSATHGSNDIWFVNNLVWPREDRSERHFGLYSPGEVHFLHNGYVGMTDSPPDESGSGVVLSFDELVDPQLDPTTGDFRPLVDSTVVGAGAATFGSGRRAPESDLSEQVRPSDAPSIGALEP